VRKLMSSFCNFGEAVYNSVKLLTSWAAASLSMNLIHGAGNTSMMYKAEDVWKCVINPLKTNILPIGIKIQFVPHRKNTTITSPLRRSSQTDVYGNFCCLFWEPDETQTHFVSRKKSYSILKQMIYMVTTEDKWLREPKDL
jgi:hypothetical protein